MEVQNLNLCMRKPTICVSKQVNKNRPVQSQKQSRTLRFRVYEEEELYCPYSENKGTDQLCRQKSGVFSWAADVRFICTCLCENGTWKKEI